MTTTRRPSTATCGDCGERTHLSNCGVDDHNRPFRTRREVAETGCNGRVYIHVTSGGIDCWAEQEVQS